MSTKSEQFLEELERTHIVLFHDGNEETKKTEYGFIKRGLEKGDHCFYTTQKPQKILEEMKSHQVNTDSKPSSTHCSISAILSVFSSVEKSK